VSEIWSTRGRVSWRVFWSLLLHVSISAVTTGADRSRTERRRASGVIDENQILHDRGKEKYEDVRQIKGSLGVPRWDGGITLFHQNRHFTVADTCFSGERFKWLGETIGGETKGGNREEGEGLL
jgi:hypothetical protein